MTITDILKIFFIDHSAVLLLLQNFDKKAITIAGCSAVISVDECGARAAAWGAGLGYESNWLMLAEKFIGCSDDTAVNSDSGVIDLLYLPLATIGNNSLNRFSGCAQSRCNLRTERDKRQVLAEAKKHFAQTFVIAVIANWLTAKTTADDDFRLDNLVGFVSENKLSRKLEADGFSGSHIWVKGVGWREATGSSWCWSRG